jgi:hypothetical protein
VVMDTSDLLAGLALAAFLAVVWGLCVVLA